MADRKAFRKAVAAIFYKFSPRRAKYTPRTNLRFMLCVFRPCRGPEPNFPRVIFIDRRRAKISALMIFLLFADAHNRNIMRSVSIQKNQPLLAAASSEPQSLLFVARTRAYVRKRSPMVARTEQSTRETISIHPSISS